MREVLTAFTGSLSSGCSMVRPLFDMTNTSGRSIAQWGQVRQRRLESDIARAVPHVYAKDAWHGCICHGLINYQSAVVRAASCTPHHADSPVSL